MDKKKLAKTLNSLNLDAYLVYDFRGSNFIGRKVLQFSPNTTRRWVISVDKDGVSKIIVPQLEQLQFKDFPGEKLTYASYSDFKERLQVALGGYKKVAIETSDNNDLPILDLVPAGFIQLLKEVRPKIEIISSENLTQSLAATWGKKGYQESKKAGQVLWQGTRALFNFIGNQLSRERRLTDFTAKEFFVSFCNKKGLTIDDGICIVATDERASNPHYWPTAKANHPIRKNSLLLVDVWGKTSQNAVYADSTFMAWIGPDKPGKEVLKVWEIAKSARDLGLEFVNDHLRDGLRGYQVDRVVRNYIKEKGYDKYFFHRTGHSIDTNEHGNGANLDDFETRDTRLIIPDTGFSIEPGIYLPKFGVRSEISVYLHPNKKVEVVTHKQDELSLI